MPTKGALTQAREKNSYTFFKDQFELIKNDFRKKQIKYKGLNVYGIDGDIYGYPISGHQGIKVNQETHFLRMYTVSAVDVFSGIPVEFGYSNQCRELELALGLLDNIEK